MIIMKTLEERLRVPSGTVDAILDTDAYNEVDDQFAIAYMLLSGDRINTVGICAAPFFNSKSLSPADGMEKSYNEILHILRLANRTDLNGIVYRGSTEYLPNETTPVISDAARRIAQKSKEYSPDNPLYIVAIGAITNVASAILLEPEAMINNTVVVWLGGHALHWENTKEFNMVQDIAGARVLFNCGCPLVQLPCNGVVSEFQTTEGELKMWLAGKNPLSDYLCDYTVATAEKYAKGQAWSRVIWDVTAVAWLLNNNERFLASRIIPAPLPEYSGIYSYPEGRHPIRYVNRVKRTPLFTDLFNKLSSCA